MTSYQTEALWRQYQPFFPEGMRCTEATTPREEWWQWRGLDVHLDRMDAPGARVKIGRSPWER